MTSSSTIDTDALLYYILQHTHRKTHITTYTLQPTHCNTHNAPPTISFLHALKHALCNTYIARIHIAICNFEQKLCIMHLKTLTWQQSHWKTHTLQHLLCNMYFAAHTLQYSLYKIHLATSTLQHTINHKLGSLHEIYTSQSEIL